MNYKVGDKVICIKEDDLPEFIGTVWVVTLIHKKFIKAENIRLFSDGSFTFFPNEVTICSSLHEVLA
jgi:hypothetical protein